MVGAVRLEMHTQMDHFKWGKVAQSLKKMAVDGDHHRH